MIKLPMQRIHFMFCNGYIMIKLPIQRIHFMLCNGYIMIKLPIQRIHFMFCNGYIMIKLPIQRIQFMALKAFAMAMASNASPCLAFKVLAISMILNTQAVRAESSPRTSSMQFKIK